MENKMKTSKTVYSDEKSVPLYLNADDICDILHISRAYAYNLFYAEGFPTINLGKRKMVRKEKFFKWLEEHEVINNG